jgi:pimeloyl-ACP methyl ester carboxylesterase
MAMYHRRSYPKGDDVAFLNQTNTLVLPYQTQGLKQVAFATWHRHCNLNTVEQVWFFVGGINTLALDWVPWFGNPAIPNTLHVFFEYPGFGRNRGYPNSWVLSQSIVQCINATQTLLHAHGNRNHCKRFALGHSLGSATALNGAKSALLNGVLLIAPFTRMNALIRYTYGEFLGFFLNLINPDRYDNLRTARHYLESNARHRIRIVHGEQDDVIPISMSHALKAIDPDRITFAPVPGAGHAGFFLRHGELVHSEMKALPAMVQP